MTQRAFVGREDEQGRLAALAAHVAGGGSRALVVVGPAGVGKSALLDRLAASAGAMTVLRAAGVQAESDLPFAALDALLRPVLDLRSALPPVQADALERALALAPGDPPDPFAIGAATLSLLGAAAEEEPVLCLVDDAHWVDASSLGAIAFAARRLGAESLGLVIAARTDRLPPALRGIEVVTVGGLPGAEARALLAGAAGDHLPSELADQLVTAADGNPLVLLELVGRLTPAQREGREALIGPLPPHARAEDLLGDRLAALPATTRDALLVAATAGDGDVALVERALASSSPVGSSGSVAVGDLAPAEAVGLVELRAGRLHFDHPLVASVAYYDAPPERRRWAHAAVAAGLPDGDARRPWHLAGAAAGPDEEVAGQLEALAVAARGRGADATGGRAALRAADLTPDPETRAMRLLAAADALAVAGHGEQAAEVIDRADALTCAPATSARIRGMRGASRLRAGDLDAAATDLRAAADALAQADPQAAGRFALDGAWTELARGAAEAFVERTTEAVRLDPRPEALALHATALVGFGRADEADPLLREVEDLLLARVRAREPVTGAAYGAMVLSLVWLERWITADRLLTALVEDARRLNAVGALPWLLTVRATLDLRLGRWDSALAAADEAVELGEAAGAVTFRASALGIREVARALRGETDVEGAGPRGIVALGAGDLATAIAALQEAADAPGFGDRPFEPDLLGALIRSGAAETAARRMEVWVRPDRVFVRATAARLEAMLVPDAEIDAAFAAALALHEDLPMPYERARTQLAYGERLRRARRRADARVPLRAALETFDALPAPAWAARARHELRTTGGMVPPRERPGSSELTAHELQVALMVAEGRTNREVAAALFLAPKTIEHHLSTIFRKLQIKRRTELAHALAEASG